ncbi:MAG TPA: serine--tRNA ligase [Spirochaetales bacterium]|nr:serine--tRNA ligase [Spirochaetales bacterium]HRV27923.1 serine--tRNA ligase [Spirochaetia bacterium]HOT59798.1 serine--tRNA ligase [Spirochaetales bacterium]HPD79752.1 serine--tRNA ligase [Spirochaetales bacterium]HQG40030.1 serine--tRNA ligase [Spirochaetales bacterium]
MLDIKFVKENLDAVRTNIKNRFMQADPDLAVKLYDERNQTLQLLEEKRKRRNEVAEAMKGKLEPQERTTLIEEGKAIKESIAQLETLLADQEARYTAELRKIPNMAHPEAPIGKEDKDNLEVKRIGTVPTFSFTPKDHVTLGSELDIIDFDTAARVTGAKFYYLKNEGVILELALVRYALDKLIAKGFVPFITPDLAKTEILEGIGFNPRGSESNVYTVNDEDLCLIGTAEITLGGYHANEILQKDKLPLKLVGVSHCFRREAGAAGQFSKGLYRVHQFTKVEMFVYCLPEESDKYHEELRLIEEEIFSSLEIPFRVVDTCTGDLGAPAYRKWDLEAWMPGRNGGEWGEVTSTSNCTDYQARRLNIRYKDDDGKNKFVHMLNGTAIACSRAIVALLENFQEADGSVRIPASLVPYCGFDRIKPKK